MRYVKAIFVKFVSFLFIYLELAPNYMSTTIIGRRPKFYIDVNQFLDGQSIIAGTMETVLELRSLRGRQEQLRAWRSGPRIHCEPSAASRSSATNIESRVLGPCN
jgi:hypothetical protein